MPVDLRRNAGFSQKKSVSVSAVHVNVDTRELFDAADSYQVFVLPPKAVITNAYLVAVQPTGSAVNVTLGTSDGGDDLLTATDASVAGVTQTFNPAVDKVATGTGVEVFMGIDAAVTDGEFVAIVEYTEYTKNTGEYTNYE